MATTLTGPAPTAAGLSRWQKVVGVLGLVVLLWVGDQMWTITYGDIGVGGHGSSQTTPTENEDQDTGPGGGGGHTPPGGGHG